MTRWDSYLNAVCAMLPGLFNEGTLRRDMLRALRGTLLVGVPLIVLSLIAQAIAHPEFNRRENTDLYVLILGTPIGILFFVLLAIDGFCRGRQTAIARNSDLFRKG